MVGERDSRSSFLLGQIDLRLARLRRALISQNPTELDGLGSLNFVMVIVATDRPDILENFDILREPKTELNNSDQGDLVNESSTISGFHKLGVRACGPKHTPSFRWGGRTQFDMALIL